MTLAPEIDGGLDFIDTLIKFGIKPQLGHTLASKDICNLSIDKGVESFTHLYNAMSGFDHREPGAVASAFSNLNYSKPFLRFNFDYFISAVAATSAAKSFLATST